MFNLVFSWVNRGNCFAKCLTWYFILFVIKHWVVYFFLPLPSVSSLLPLSYDDLYVIHAFEHLPFINALYLPSFPLNLHPKRRESLVQWFFTLFLYVYRVRLLPPHQILHGQLLCVDIMLAGQQHSWECHLITYGDVLNAYCVKIPLKLIFVINYNT